MYSKLVNYVDALNHYRKSKISNRNFLVFAALIVGALSGLAAALLKTITHHIEEFLQSGFQWQYKYYLFFFFPFIGIFLSVLYVRRFIRKSKFEIRPLDAHSDITYFFIPITALVTIILVIVRLLLKRNRRTSAE